MRRVPPIAIAVLTAAALVACEGDRVGPSVVPPAGGDADRGGAIILSLGCGACHAIPGIRAARGEVGPPLDGFARRTMFAASTPNSADNVVKFLMDPKAFVPTTAMPKLGLSEREARDVVTYLYSLD